MTDATFVLSDHPSFDRRPLSRRHSSRTVTAATAAVVMLLTCTWMLDETRKSHNVATVSPAPAPSVAAAILLPPARPAQPAPAAAPVTFVYSLGFAPLTLDRSAPLSAAFVPVAPLRVAADPPPADAVPAPDLQAQLPMPRPASTDSVPLPEPSPLIASVPLPEARPPDFRKPASRWAVALPQGRASRRDVVAAAPSAVATPTDNRGFLERFFGGPQPSGPSLAYAAPEDGLFGRTRGMVANPAGAPDRFTAVYDIAAHTVYMPDGTRLEAHSGLGELLDDPRHVDARNRGATPPHLYDLEPREKLFHGVQALRLNPVGGSGVFGRTGLLAHTYMLGPKGDSNGCVSFRDYKAFLQAYANGQVKRLVVVAGTG